MLGVEDVVGLVESGELFLAASNPLFVADLHLEAVRLQVLVTRHSPRNVMQAR